MVNGVCSQFLCCTLNGFFHKSTKRGVHATGCCSRGKSFQSIPKVWWCLTLLSLHHQHSGKEKHIGKMSLENWLGESKAFKKNLENHFWAVEVIVGTATALMDLERLECVMKLNGFLSRGTGFFLETWQCVSPPVCIQSLHGNQLLYHGPLPASILALGQRSCVSVSSRVEQIEITWINLLNGNSPHWEKLPFFD